MAMVVDTSIVTTVVTAGAGIIFWAVRQEGRINGHDKLFIERDKQAIERHEDAKARLVRIENKLDSLPYLSSK